VIIFFVVIPLCSVVDVRYEVSGGSVTNVVRLKEFIDDKDELSSALPSINTLSENQREALATAQEFSKTTEQLQSALGKLESACREYRDELKRLDAEPIRRKSIRLMRLADSWTQSSD
jgi:vacuolar-type H+-ATPase subunit C/Vma6